MLVDTVHQGTRDKLHVIVCIEFDPRGPAHEIDAFKRYLIECADISYSAELMGAYDFMFEVVVDDLEAYNDRLKEIAAPLTKLVIRHDTNFVCKSFDRSIENDCSIWVPCNNGMERLDSSRIDKVTAEGDYVRIYSLGASWLIHATMRSIRNRLGTRSFVQVHRSLLVRCDFISKMIRENRRWIVLMKDGTSQQVPKGHLDEVKAALQVDPPNSKTAFVEI